MNRTVITPLLALLMMVGVTACGTTDTQMAEHGESQAYITGFHDGRHSGMKEQGNVFEHWIRDENRFGEEADYRRGWLEGEAEGKRMQKEALAAGAVAAGAYGGYKVGKEVDKQTDYERIGEKAVKDVDTSSLKSLEDHN